jgi:hypothetical protein
MLSFDSKSSQFQLDDEPIGDYIEVCEINKTKAKRVNGKSCYYFRMLLTLYCDDTDSIYVDFYTFDQSIRDHLLVSSGLDDNTCLRIDDHVMEVRPC